MVRRLPILYLCALVSFPASGQPRADWADPLIGTRGVSDASHPAVYPAVALPFGMAAWSPQTDDGRRLYDYGDERFQGFTLTHGAAFGGGEGGRVTFMPLAGAPALDPEGRASAFSHDREVARPYYYSAHLDRYGVDAEVTATLRGGHLRLTYPATDSAFLAIDLYKEGAYLGFFPEEGKLVGYTRSRTGGLPGNFAMYFVALFDRAFDAYGAWVDGEVHSTGLEHAGTHVRGYVRLRRAAGAVVEVRVGTSFIGIEQAERNLRAEIGARSFEDTQSAARAAWEGAFEKIDLDGATEAQRRAFYTAYYRTLLSPRIGYEFDGAGREVHYGRYDGLVHEGPAYDGIDLDDAFWTDFPFLGLLHPRRHAEILQGLVNAYEEGGRLPHAPAASAFADAYVKGIRGFDAARAYRELVDDTPAPGEEGQVYYKDLGYVPADRVRGATAHTLAFAYADFCVAQLAQALGRAEDHAYYLARSLSYRNLFDPRDGRLKDRAVDGTWHRPAEPLGRRTPWAVPHDPQGLIDVMGGNEAFVARLDSAFAPPGMDEAAGFADLRHEPYLYNYAGRPWKTQARVREAMDFLTASERLAGRDDGNPMWSWYLFSALGFYSVAPGRPEYVIGRPHFPGVTLHLPGGKSFVIETRGHGLRNTYIQAARLNGQPLTRSWLSHRDLTAGGVLTFIMGPEPGYAWSSTAEAVPASVSEPGGRR